MNKSFSLGALVPFLIACQCSRELYTAPPEATATFLVASSKPIAAFEHLRSSTGVGASSFGEVAHALAEAGQRELAFEAYECALEREVWEEDWLTAMCELDSNRALASLESIMASYPYAEDEALGEVHDGYARCLQATGCDAAATALLGDPSSRIRQPSGCVGWNVRGEAWEWEAWKVTEPETVVGLFQPILESNYGYRGFALKHLVDVAESRGDRAATLSALALYKNGGTYDPVLYAELYERFVDDSGWQELELAMRAEPDEADLVFPLAEYYERSGRPARAFELRLAWIETDSNSPLHMDELLAAAPHSYVALLDARFAQLEARDLVEDLDELFGGLASCYREIGCKARAIELYERARELDPYDSEWWEALRHPE